MADTRRSVLMNYYVKGNLPTDAYLPPDAFLP